MSAFDIPQGISLWHYGILGQKWGVRRTADQLGHDSKGDSKVAKYYEHVKIVNGVYHSPKGFTAAIAKLARYCLNPEKPHANEFFGVGYKQSDSDILLRHIEEGYDYSKRRNNQKLEYGERFEIPMLLGVTSKKMFNTGWQIDNGRKEPKFVTAYIDRRLRKEATDDV